MGDFVFLDLASLTPHLKPARTSKIVALHCSLNTAGIARWSPGISFRNGRALRFSKRQDLESDVAIE